VRIAAVHPDRSVREALKRTLATRARTELIWVAANEPEAKLLFQQQPPDLLLLDVAFSGASAAWVKQLTAADDCSVLMLADDPDRAVGSVYEALGAGALGVSYPPNISPEGELTGTSALLVKLDRVGSLVRLRGARVHTLVEASVPYSDSVTTQARAYIANPVTVTRVLGPRMIALGASTGGPNALLQVLCALNTSAPVLIVQHIEGEFVEGLAHWLGKQTQRTVCLAKRGEVPQPNTVYLADGQGHLVYLPNGQLTYLAANHIDLHVPSVDMLFQSLADNAVPGAAALLTGMGADGAQGLLKMRQRGWFTIAQDESSSAVFGMPRAAMQLGAATRMVELPIIGETLVQQLNKNIGKG
jgi:two-component system, chemotaxis family, response regulator WspF